MPGGAHARPAVSRRWFAFTLVLVYFTWGEIYSLFPSTSGDYFGTQPRHVELRGAVHGEGRRPSIIGGWVGALLFEQSGSWAMGFYGSAVMALVAAGIAFGLRNARAGRACARSVRCPAQYSPSSYVRVDSEPATAARRHAHALADELQQARQARRADVMPPSARGGAFDLDAAYAVERELVAAAAGRRAARPSAARSATPTRRCGAR